MLRQCQNVDTPAPVAYWERSATRAVLRASSHERLWAVAYAVPKTTVPARAFDTPPPMLAAAFAPGTPRRPLLVPYPRVAMFTSGKLTAAVPPTARENDFAKVLMAISDFFSFYTALCCELTEHYANYTTAHFRIAKTATDRQLIAVLRPSKGNPANYADRARHDARFLRERLWRPQ